MRARKRLLGVILALALLAPQVAVSQNSSSRDFKQIQAQLTEYKRWLDQVGVAGLRYWVRVENNRRPHRLFVAEGFLHAEHSHQEQFIEIFSRYLAGHPERNMLIDIYDAGTGRIIGEYGFSGFRLYSSTHPDR